MISTRCQYSAVTSISGFLSRGSLVEVAQQGQSYHQDDADGEVDRTYTRDQPVNP